MERNFVIRIVSRATLWTAALSLVVCLVLVPGTSAQTNQDNQRVTPSQEPGQPPAMQRPETTPAEPKAEPEMNSPNPQQDIDRPKDQDRDRDRSPVSQGHDQDTTQKEVAEFDKFLDSHPEVAQELRSNPSLVNDHQYVSSHKGLQEFLEKHPEVREEIKKNPQAFMHKEKRYERQEEQRPPQQ
jgi:hypothetical protein